MTEKIKDLFYQTYSVDLLVAMDESLGNSTWWEQFIKRELIKLSNFIGKYNVYFNYDKLSEDRKEQFNKILVEQIMYTLENGDLSTWNGVDGGAVVDKERVKTLVISPMAEDMLCLQGFLTSAQIW